MLPSFTPFFCCLTSTPRQFINTNNPGGHYKLLLESISPQSLGVRLWKGIGHEMSWSHIIGNKLNGGNIVVMEKNHFFFCTKKIERTCGFSSRFAAGVYPPTTLLRWINVSFLSHGRNNARCILSGDHSPTFHRHELNIFRTWPSLFAQDLRSLFDGWRMLWFLLYGHLMFFHLF